MIQLQNVSKSFEQNFLTDISLDIPQGRMLGLLGSNGSGKSTLLRLLAGVYQADGGTLTVEGQPLFENIAYKRQLFFAPDEPYFPLNASLSDMKRTYHALYGIDDALYTRLLATFGLPAKKNINNFSKGQKRQALMILALATQPKYLLLDEIFDGLDLVMKDVVKKAIMEQMASHDMTVIMTTHNIADLGSMCDQLCLLHRGKLVLNRDTDSMGDYLTRVHMSGVANLSQATAPTVLADCHPINLKYEGNLISFSTRLPRAELRIKLGHLDPSYLDMQPCGLEEVFLAELQQVGYGGQTAQAQPIAQVKEQAISPEQSNPDFQPEATEVSDDKHV